MCMPELVESNDGHSCCRLKPLESFREAVGVNVLAEFVRKYEPLVVIRTSRSKLLFRLATTVFSQSLDSASIECHRSTPVSRLWLRDAELVANGDQRTGNRRPKSFLVGIAQLPTCAVQCSFEVRIFEPPVHCAAADRGGFRRIAD